MWALYLFSFKTEPPPVDEPATDAEKPTEGLFGIFIKLVFTNSS